MLAAACLFVGPQTVRGEKARPSLVLFVVVDQLRGDMPEQYLPRFGPDGFRFFFDNGVVYRNAFFGNGATETGPGHATLFTGATPVGHGIVGNDWIDPESGHEVYCTADSDHHVFGESGSHLPGTSPAYLTAETIGDVLVRSGTGKSRIFSISTKDRSAILMGGRQGKAFWYSRQTGRFVTSSYYYPENPEWLERWNARRLADRWKDAQWRLLRPREQYRFATRDDQPWERDYRGLGRTFPHSFDKVATQDYYTVLRYTPFANDLTIDFVAEVMKNHQLGADVDTDLLAISLSVTDRVGHIFGPDSLEAEDNMLRVDQQLATLLAMVDRQVGLENTLVILSADHGIPSAPEFLELNGSTAARIDTPRLISDINASLRKRFDTKENLIVSFLDPAFYLNIKAIERENLDLGVVEKFVAESMATVDGIEFVLTRSDILAGRITRNRITDRMVNAFHPTRSGNVFPVPDSGWVLQSIPWLYAASHGSPLDYDAHVALMMAHGRGEPTIVDRTVVVENVAPTIAAYLGVDRPSASTGAPLEELFRDRTPSVSTTPKSQRESEDHERE